MLDVHLPKHDNLHLAWIGVLVDPRHRRRGHGTALVAEAVRQTEEAGRTTLWVDGVEADAGSRAFAERQGFRYASHDARRVQRLEEVDAAAMDRLGESATAAAADYVLERSTAPTEDDRLAEFVAVTAAINDAPMGSLDFEDEHFDLQRLKDLEAAAAGRGDTLYRVAARHRETGEVGGHTMMIISPYHRERAGQGDTAVAREHRGHRLGLLLKIDMMRWLADTEPQLEIIETWNHADNTFMINVNESIGYRLANVYATYERKLT